MLSLTTLNSWKCDGRYRDRLSIMTGAFRRLRPDILLLQEAFAAPEAKLDTAARLAEALGYDCAAACARRKPRRYEGRLLDSTSSPAILTRGTIQDCRAVPLSSDPEDGERLSQIADIGIDGLRILAVNVHLTYLPGRDRLRREQIAQTLAALPALEPFDAALMAGDFNCAPDSPPIRWLTTNAGLRVTDPCLAAGADFVTHEAQPRLGRPAQRIDYVFQIEPLDRASRWTVTNASRVLDVPDPALAITASDHYGVSVRLEPRVRPT